MGNGRMNECREERRRKIREGRKRRKKGGVYKYN